MAIEVAWAAKATVTETLPNNTPSAAAAKRQVVHDQFDETGTLNAGTTPPVTLVAEFQLTLTGGAATIDLRNLVGTNGAVVDGNGLRLQILRMKNLGSNDMTFKQGATNPYSIGAGIVLPAGAIHQLMFNDGISDIDATHKTIDVTGTGAQGAEITVILG